jgi:hypothetical protein
MNKKDRMRIAAAEAQGWTGPWRFVSEHLHGTAPVKKPIHVGENVPEEIDKIIVELHRDIGLLLSAIGEVRALINESKGVDGLHLNGDVALWSELEDNGKYCEWLWTFNKAEKLRQKYE